MDNRGGAQPPLARAQFRSRIPLWLKALYTIFMAVLVPVYWAHAGAATFLWLCDVALFTLLAGLWLESSLLISMPALAMLFPQLAWQIDFTIQLIADVKIFGPGVADYMFNPAVPLLNRALSTFHFWLPCLLLWCLWRLGYDRRAAVAQTLLTWVILPLSYLFTELDGPAGNVNKVHGWSNTEPQTWMPPWAWLALLMAFFPLCWYAPLHFLFRRTFRAPHQPRSS